MLNDVELVFTGDQKKHHLLKKKIPVFQSCKKRITFSIQYHACIKTQ